jgi:hypothetical protein
MRRGDAAFVAYIAALAAGVAFMAVNQVAAVGSAIPAARQAGGVAAITPSSAEMVKLRAGLGARYWR